MKFTPLIIFALLCLLFAFAVITPKQPAPSLPLLGKAFPVLTLEEQDVNALLGGRVTMINLFASWCMPCAVEQPTLVKMAESNLFPIIGIAWKNKPADAEAWLYKRGNPYTELLFDEQGDSTITLALTGVPESFIVDKKGIVRYHTREPLTDETLTKEIIPLVKRLEGE